jgi:hypothetical protein
VVIEGGNKVGKSAFLAASLAATFGKNTGDCLGWESDGNPKNHAVIHVDSEQSRGDHDAMIRRAIRRSGITDIPGWFESYCLSGWELDDARFAIRVLLEDALLAHGGIHSVYLDGAADFIGSVNDEIEACAWVREIHAIAINFSCAVFVVIHLNPRGLSGQEKSRGHLGSQIDRKAETVLRITKDGNDVSKVETRFARHAHIPPDIEPRYAWDSDAKFHVAAPTRINAKKEKSRSDLLDLAKGIFDKNCDRNGISWSTLARKAGDYLKTVGKPSSSKTIERRIKEMIDAGVIKKDPNNCYLLKL